MKNLNLRGLLGIEKAIKQVLEVPHEPSIFYFLHRLSYRVRERTEPYYSYLDKMRIEANQKVLKSMEEKIPLDESREDLQELMTRKIDNFVDSSDVLFDHEEILGKLTKPKLSAFSDKTKSGILDLANFIDMEEYND